MALVMAGVLASARGAMATTYTVDSTADTADDNIGDNLCHTAGGVCTLRAAIQQANAHSGTDTIDQHGIATVLASALPSISEAVTITDTLSVAGTGWRNSSPPVPAGSIDSSALASTDVIFDVQIAGVTIRGVKVFSSGHTGIGVSIHADNATVQSSVFDTLAKGVIVFDGADNPLIGGSNPGDGNLIEHVAADSLATWSDGPAYTNTTFQGNDLEANFTGIEVFEANNGTVIDNNKSCGATDGAGGVGIGLTDNTGTITVTRNRVCNNARGFRITTSTSPTIGGATLSDANMIVGNTTDGVWIESGTSVVLQNNYVGVEDDGVTCNANAIDFTDNGTSTSGAACGSNGNVCCPATPTPTPIPPGCCVISGLNFGFDVTCLDDHAQQGSMTSLADCQAALSGLGAPPSDATAWYASECTQNESPPGGDPTGGYLSGVCAPPPTATATATETPVVGCCVMDGTLGVTCEDSTTASRTVDSFAVCQSIANSDLGHSSHAVAFHPGYDCGGDTASVCVANTPTPTPIPGGDGCCVVEPGCTGILDVGAIGVPGGLCIDPATASGSLDEATCTTQAGMSSCSTTRFELGGSCSAGCIHPGGTPLPGRTPAVEHARAEKVQIRKVDVRKALVH